MCEIRYQVLILSIYFAMGSSIIGVPVMTYYTYVVPKSNCHENICLILNCTDNRYGQNITEITYSMYYDNKTYTKTDRLQKEKGDCDKLKGFNNTISCYFKTYNNNNHDSQRIYYTLRLSSPYEIKIESLVPLIIISIWAAISVVPAVISGIYVYVIDNKTNYSVINNE